jgi:hypothetical protein
MIVSSSGDRNATSRQMRDDVTLRRRHRAAESSCSSARYARDLDRSRRGWHSEKAHGRSRPRDADAVRVQRSAGALPHAHFSLRRQSQKPAGICFHCRRSQTRSIMRREVPKPKQMCLRLISLLRATSWIKLAGRIVRLRDTNGRAVQLTRAHAAFGAPSCSRRRHRCMCSPRGPAASAWSCDLHRPFEVSTSFHG